MRTYDIYRDIQTPSPSRPRLFDRAWALIDVAVSAPETRRRCCSGVVAVPHGEDGPLGTHDGRPVPTPYNPALAAQVAAYRAHEQRVREIVGDLSGLTARQRKYRRQKARRSLPPIPELAH